MNKSEILIDNIESILEKNTMSRRFHIHVTGPDEAAAPLLKAHATTPEEIHSVLHRAADHIKTGGMSKIKAKVHDTVKNKYYTHNLSRAVDNNIEFKGPDINSYAK